MTTTTTYPAVHTSLKITGSNTFTLASDEPLPKLEEADVLVRVAAVSVNHVDGKSADMSPSPGATSGTDFAGVIVALGSELKKSDWKTTENMEPLQIGDRVMGGIFGNNPLRLDNGAFAEYVAVPARLVWHIPADMDFATASTLPAAIATVGLSLFQYLQLPLPPVSASASSSEADEKPFVLVHGGGMYKTLNGSPRTPQVCADQNLLLS